MRSRSAARLASLAVASDSAARSRSALLASAAEGSVASSDSESEGGRSMSPR